MTAPGNTTISVTVTLHDYLSGPAATAASAVTHLADEIKKLNRVLLILDNRIDKVNKSLMSYILHMHMATSATNDLSRSIIGLNAQMASTNVHINTFNSNSSNMSNNMNNMNRNTSQNTRSVRENRKEMLSWSKIMGKTTAALRMLGMALAIVGAGAFAGKAIQQTLVFVHLLESLLSFAGLAPIALMSLVGVLGTTILATKGFSDGLKALSADQGAFNEAIKNLAPSAQAVLKTLRTFVPQFKTLRKAVQDEFFKPVNVYLKGMIDNVMPMVTRGMKAVATEMGITLSRIAQFFSTPQGAAFFQAMFAGAQAFAGLLNRVVFPLLLGMSDMMVATLPTWQRLMDAMDKGLSKFGVWMSDISKSGDLARTLNDAFFTAKMLWGMLANIAGVLQDIIKAASSAGGFGFDVLLKQVKEWTSSAEGQKTMIAIFRALGDIARELAPIVTALATAIGTALAPAIQPIVSFLGPALQLVVEGLAKALEFLLPYWGPLSSAIGQLISALAPLLPALGPIAAIIGQLLTNALRELVVIITPLVPIISHFVEVFGGLFLNMLQQAMPLMADAFAQIGQILTQLEPVFTQLIDLIGGALHPVFDQIVNVLIQAIPVFLQLGQVIVTTLVTAFQELAPFIPDLLSGFTSLFLAFLQLIPAILPLVTAFANLLVAAAPLIPIIADIIGVFFGLMGVVFKVIAAIITFVAQSISGLGSLVAWVTGNFGKIYDWIVNPFTRAKDVIAGVIGSISGMVSGLVGKIGDLMGKIGSLNPFRAFGGSVESGQKYTVGEIGREMFVPNVGKPYLIGKHGMEERTFSSGGTVIPSFLLDAMDDANKQAVRDARALLSRDPGSGDHTQAFAARKGQEPAKSEHTWNLNFSGANFTKEMDVESAVEKGVSKAMKKYEQQRRERS